MNERIKELVKQAGGHFSTHTLTSYPAQHRESIQLWDQNIEKFAELLLEECMTTILKESKWYWDKDEFESSNAIQNAARRLKEHFGVEE